jgi:hypothetical protein
MEAIYKVKVETKLLLIILTCIFKGKDGKVRSRLLWRRIINKWRGLVRGIEVSGFVKYAEFLA